MLKLFRYFLLSPQDIGAEHYSVKEIADMMKPVDKVDDSSLYDFARTVSFFLENDTPTSSEESSLTNKVRS